MDRALPRGAIFAPFAVRAARPDAAQLDRSHCPNHRARQRRDRVGKALDVRHHVMPTSPPVHQPAGAQQAADRRLAYDRSKARHYTKRRWFHLRKAYLATHPLCECGCGYPATVVDHRTPHNGNDALLYAWTNLQAMAKACHDRKTATFDGGFGNTIKTGV